MRIVLALKRLEFIGDRRLYITLILRGRWWDIIVLNVNASNTG
jgi:hypothetical protein